MATVSIETEEEREQGWKFTATIQYSGESSPSPHPTSPQKIEMTLSWADYDHWTAGTRPPSAIANAVIKFFLKHLATDEKLPHRFDASIIRRKFPDLDPDATLHGA